MPHNDSVSIADIDRAAKCETPAETQVGGDLVENAGVPIDARASLPPDRSYLVLKLLDTLQSIIKLLP